MGKEAVCVARHEGGRVEGKALLESDEVLFRSPTLRLRISRKDLTRVEVEEGWLVLGHPGGEVAFDLRAQAAKWAEELRNPRTRLDKIGVKAGQRAWLKGVTDAALPAELAAKGVEVVSSRARPKEVDVAFLQVDDPGKLGEVVKAADALAKAGALWVVTPRGVEGLKDVDVMAVARAAGLVDVKVVRFSETHTALKFVLPKEKR